MKSFSAIQDPGPFVLGVRYNEQFSGRACFFKWSLRFKFLV